MSKWFYKGRCITCVDDTDICCPFMIYQIQFSDGSYYVGSKQLFSVRRVKLSTKRSKALYSGRGSYPKYETKRTESDWLSYNSSSNIVKKKLESEKATFEILEFLPTKQHMLLAEAYLIIHGFLTFDQKMLNEWISVKSPKLKKEK